MSVTASHERESLKDSKEEEDKQLYKGAFDDFDWNKNGTIPTRVVSFPPRLAVLSITIFSHPGPPVRNAESWPEPNRCGGAGPDQQD